VDRRKPQASTLAFMVLLMGSALSYVSPPGAQQIGYVVAFSGLCGLVLALPVMCRTRAQNVLVICLLMLSVSLASMLLATDYSTSTLLIVQTGLYPIVLAILLLHGWQVLGSNRQALATFAACLGLVNGLVALLSSLGVITSLPLIGTIETGRLIFGTSIPSSTGLAFNVNYYATLQGTLFLLYSWLVSDGGGRSKRYHVAIGAYLLGSSLIGSSRGVLAGLIAVGIVWLALRLVRWRYRAKLQVVLVALPFIALGVLLVAPAWPAAADALRVDRGLNYRDALWSAGLELWMERPLLGYGYAAATSDLLGHMVDRAGSLHSGYLETLNRGGALLFGLVYGSVITIVLSALRLSRDRWCRNGWPVAIVVFWLVNSAFRTFTLGGLGLLPVAAGLALSSILYSNYRDRRQTFGCGAKESAIEPFGARGG
jgi:O-antigen ligase